jgi:hypothetical protein
MTGNPFISFEFQTIKVGSLCDARPISREFPFRTEQVLHR